MLNENSKSNSRLSFRAGDQREIKLFYLTGFIHNNGRKRDYVDDDGRKLVSPALPFASEMQSPTVQRYVWCDRYSCRILLRRLPHFSCRFLLFVHLCSCPPTVSYSSFLFYLLWYPSMFLTLFPFRSTLIEKWELQAVKRAKVEFGFRGFRLPGCSQILDDVNEDTWLVIFT